MLPLPVDLACPDAAPNPGVRVEVVSAGIIGSDWGQVVDDGTTGPVALPSLVGVVRVGGRTVIVDAGLGRTTRAGTYPSFPLNQLGEISVPDGTAIVERLAAPPDLVLMTHLHYDHVGGLFDLPGVPVWTTREDWAAFAPGAPGFPRRLRDAVQWQPQDMGPMHASRVLGRPAHDVLGDGNVWYLSLPGHTPGAAAVLVRAEDGPWLFVGDTAWVDRHLADTRRPLSTRLLLDSRPDEALESLEWARWLKASCPELTIVVGHEPSLMEGRSSTSAP